MKKKLLSLILALLMTASAASTVLAADDAAIAEDPVEEAEVVEAKEVGKYDRAIEFLANYGIFKGYSADDTGANDLIERYQMALFVSRISTGWVDDEQWEDGPENWSEFSDIDVDPVNKYFGALSYASQKNIIEGYGDGTFGPQDHINYQNALTMVVRTLGYTNLDWPWGYIEQAVKLGLTDGIEGVAYTDDLTRGEVAQIIYNALFATSKNGTKLAMTSFGVEFGWEKVIITASDLNIFTADKEKAYKGLESNNSYSEWKDSYKTADGYVAFKLLEDDGSLGDDTYYIAADDIGLSTAANSHDDEAVVGDAYYMLFEKDEDSDICKVVAYESLLTETLWNEGKTDDKGNAQDYPIEAFKKNYTLVSKYSDKSYVNTTKTGKPEIMVFNGVGGITEEYVAGNYIAIDWATGDILAPVTDDNGNPKKNADGNYEYKIAWYYNDLLGKYYRYTYEVADENGLYSVETNDKILTYADAFGIDYMTDAEFEDFYKSLNYTAKKNYKGFEQTVLSITKSAYSSLKLFDTDLDGEAERGIYESYRLGYFTESTVWDSGCGASKPSYKITDVGTLTNAVKSADIKDDGTLDNDGDVVTAGFNTIVEGTSCAHIADRAWFVEGYEPEVKLDEDGKADGYKAGYVIYNYDAETGAIKVVKNINDGTDADSYVATGVVRAYNVKNGTVTIGDTKFSIKDYDELEGNGFKYVTANWKTRAQYTALLRDLFNQFVTYVVVDGELVHIEAANATKNEVIVVDSYAGLSSDGYIVVNGYSSSDLEYARFRIGSYNGWMKGDYYYYLTEAKAKASFSKGAIYAITSYDKEEDVYYVELAGEFTEDYVDNLGNTVYNYEVDSDKVANLDRTVTIKGTGEGYFEYTDSKTGKTTSVKMKDSDKYIIIPKTVEGKPYAAIKVYEGKLGAEWEVEGNVINTTTPDNRTYVIINAEINKGFVDTYASGLVLLLSDKYISANYNGADSEDWYLLGATEVEVEVFNLLTGNEANVILPGTNIDLEVGHVYFTQDGVIVEDLGVLAIKDLTTIMADAYPSNDPEIGSYLYGSFQVTDKNYADIYDKAKLADMGTTSINDLYGHSKYRDTISGDIDVFAFEYDDDVITEVSDKMTKASQLKKYMDKYDEYTVWANWVLDLSNNNIVIYISITDGTFTTVSDEKLSDAFVVEKLTDAEIKGQVIYEEVKENGKVVAHNILGVRYYFEGDAVEGLHAKIIENGYAFGLSGEHFAEGYTVTYVIDRPWGTWTATGIVYDSIVKYEYDKAADCEDCDLVQCIEVYFDKDDVQTIQVLKNSDGTLDIGQIAFTVKIDAKDATNLFTATTQDYVDGSKWGYEDVVSENLSADAMREEIFTAKSVADTALELVGGID